MKNSIATLANLQYNSSIESNHYYHISFAKQQFASRNFPNLEGKFILNPVTRFKEHLILGAHYPVHPKQLLLARLAVAVFLPQS